MWIRYNRQIGKGNTILKMNDRESGYDTKETDRERLDIFQVSIDKFKIWYPIGHRMYKQ